jgi:tetratricopeptide (TPR) repeat protein
MKHFLTILTALLITGCTEEFFYQKHLRKNYGDYESKLASYNHRISENTTDATAYYERGILLTGLGQYDESLADLNRVIELQPNFAEAYLVRGYLKYNYWRFRSDKTIFKDALTDADKLIELNHKKYDAYLLRGRVHEGINGYDKSLKDYSMAIDLNPKGADAYYSRASLLYYKFHNITNSLEDLNTAYNLFKSDGDKEGQRRAKDLKKFIIEMKKL